VLDSVQASTEALRQAGFVHLKVQILGLVDLSRWIIRQHDGLVQLLSPKTNHDNPSCQGQC